jgi:carbamate kinase
MPESIVVALGGNALVLPDQRGTVAEQRANLEHAMAAIAELARRDHRIVVTHGNGPQVGHMLIRSEAARGQAYELPLYLCVAETQGETGFLIVESLHNLLWACGVERPVVALLTRTIVGRDAAGFEPTKPIGPFLSAIQADRLRREGEYVSDDAGRGYRRRVPSPPPTAIVESGAIRLLLDRGVIVVAVGGGGVPMYLSDDASLHALDAVVDKDSASSVLALQVGATRILDLTAVDSVKLHFGTPAEQSLRHMTVATARRYLAEGHFAPGSMGPKIEAAIDFLEGGGHEVLITRPELAMEAWHGRAGTRIVPA